MPPNEAFSRVEIDWLLKDAAWDLTDGHSVRYECRLSNGTRADYVLCDRHGPLMAVIEAKRSTLNPAPPHKAKPMPSNSKYARRSTT
jgi:type I restriction enzyme R subunit